MIGAGSQGVVYLAERMEPRQRVALKVLQLPDERRRRVVLRYFRREQRHLAWLNHPGIVKLYDVGETERGDPYFVMEHVEGPTLEDYCRDYGPDTDETLRIFVQICKAVSHFHHLQVIHRDLKPTNILISSPDGVAVPKIVDFGLSKATHPGLQSLSDPSSGTVGTWFYLSPETVFGKKPGIAADVYSLGAILHEMLVGLPPFHELVTASESEMYEALRNRTPPTPSSILSQRAALHESSRDQEESKRRITRMRNGLDAILLQALAKNPEHRFASAADMAMAVEKQMEPTTRIPRPPERMPQVSGAKTSLSIRWAWGLLAAAVAVAAAILCL